MALDVSDERGVTPKQAREDLKAHQASTRLQVCSSVSKSELSATNTHQGCQNCILLKSLNTWCSAKVEGQLVHQGQHALLAKLTQGDA